MNLHRFVLSGPAGFDFYRTALSHGWAALRPFAIDREKKILTFVASLPSGRLVHCTITGTGRRVRVRAQSSFPLTAADSTSLKGQIRTCLRLDDDLTEFHDEARKHPQYRWIPKSGAGRMLRSPTVFEDAVKTLCTTNCTWALTTVMVNNFVDVAGVAEEGVGAVFPTPAAIASMTERELRTKVKAGYRSPFILEFARRVASGSLDVEAWKTSPASTEDLIDEIRGVKGMGPYAAGNLLKLLGRYDDLALDSWVRSKFYELHTRGRKVKDATIEKHYREYGRWRGLFFWLEMTKEWHDKFDNGDW